MARAPVQVRSRNALNPDLLEPIPLLLRQNSFHLIESRFSSRSSGQERTKRRTYTPNHPICALYAVVNVLAAGREGRVEMRE